MKTAEQINIEISQLESQRTELGRNLNHPDEKTKKKAQREYDRAGKQAAFLRSCLFYIEGQPRKEFVEKQLERLEAKLEFINNGFFEWHKNNPNPDNKDMAKRKAEYNAACDVKNIKNQIKTLTYILN